MILARLSAAIRAQNWLAVALEFVIVIAGVVIGFQIAGASERVASLQYERDLLERLHGQIISLEEGREYNRRWVSMKRDRLVEVRPLIFGVAESEAIDSRQCFALLESHWLANPADALPALDELVSTGRMETIRNHQIRERAGRYLQMRDVARRQIESDLESLVSLPDRFPDYFHVELIPDPEEEDDGWDRRSVCQLDAMRADGAFQLYASGNIEIYRNLLNFHYDFVGDQLESLHTALDAELGHQHAETSP